MTATRARTATCRACGAAAAGWRVATPSDERLASRPRYDLVRCGTCGSAAIADGQRELEQPALYAEGSYAASTRLEPVLEALRRLVDRDRLRTIGPLAPHGEVLELGAGDGRLLAALARRGHPVAGIEPSAPYAAQARARGLDVAAIGFEDVVRAPESCDAVILWHVLEHLAEPERAVRLARTWLRPGGTLAVAVPNLASLQARIGGDRWFHQDVPRHLTHFTPAGLTALLERCGFRVTRIRHLVLEHNVLGMWQSLLNRVTRERDVAFRMLKRMELPAGGRRRRLDVALTMALGAALVPVAALAEAAAGTLGRGGTIVVRAA